MMRDIRGQVVVTVTPFLRGETPDLEEIKRQTEALCLSGTDGIFPCSSTGEYPKLSFADKLRIMRTVSETNRGRKFLIAGACAVSLEEVKRCIDAARELAYDACLVCPPYYYPLKQEEVLAFYRDICAYAKDMRIIAYNVPFFTTEITLDTFRELLAIPNLAGMKDSSGNLKKISHECDLAREMKPDFVLYSGTDDCLLPSLAAGVRGCMTALSAIFPDTVKRIFTCYEAGQLEEAIRIQRSLLSFLRLADSLVFPEGYKLAAKAAGLRVGELSVLSDPAKAAAVYAGLQEEMKKIPGAGGKAPAGSALR